MRTTTIQKVDCLFQAKISSVILVVKNEKLSHNARGICHTSIEITPFDKYKQFNNSTINT